jgi:hypothetical protein
MRRLLTCGVCAFLLAALCGSTEAADPKPGTVIGPDTAAQAKDLLPNELYQRYAKGEFLNEVAEPKPGTKMIDPEFIAAGAANRGKYTVSDVGTIIDSKTGKQPTYVYGPPFPDIDKNDPQAGVKLIWNFFYQSYILGDDHNTVGLSWVARHGVDRESAQDVWQKFFDGQGPDRPRPDNPNNLLFQQLVQTQFPADLKGTVALTWRYRDTKRDNTWAYVPALRRVRAVSPTNRSDGFLGSDMSQDDGSYFDGKPEDFKWKLVGEGEVLCLRDRASVVEGKSNFKKLPDGGWRAVFPPKPRFGFQAKDAKVVPWAPLPERTVLVKYPVYRIEAVPRDTYYLYGNIALQLEKESYRGCYNSKSDWRGGILNTYTPLQGAWFKVDDGKGPWRGYSESQFTMAQNWKLDRATASYPYADDPTVAADSLITIDAKLFDYQSMVQYGR